MSTAYNNYMNDDRSTTHVVSADQAGQTLAALVRAWQPGLSWKQARGLIEGRRVAIGASVCLDPARRLTAGESVTIAHQAAAKTPKPEQIPIRYLDGSVVVVEKPAGVATVRHVSERDWPESRKRLQPTLDELVLRQISARDQRPRGAGRYPPLRIVQRLDRPTSGLIVFARTPQAQAPLIHQFRARQVHRRYLAIIEGRVGERTIENFLVRDRGDGRRGSTKLPDAGKKAITHIEPIEELGGYQLVRCRLKTGRTHQIRIHLAELGHPVLGEPVYRKPLFGEATPDTSGAPRLALHAAELGFLHPISGGPLYFEAPLPPDLDGLLARLRERAGLRSKDEPLTDESPSNP